MSDHNDNDDDDFVDDVLNSDDHQRKFELKMGLLKKINKIKVKIIK